MGSAHLTVQVAGAARFGLVGSAAKGVGWEGEWLLRIQRCQDQVPPSRPPAGSPWPGALASVLLAVNSDGHRQGNWQAGNLTHLSPPGLFCGGPISLEGKLRPRKWPVIGQVGGVRGRTGICSGFGFPRIQHLLHGGT
jgi:hypothetical protein